MYQLTKHDVEVIAGVIDRAEITFSHLRDDLIDHVCCQVENELRNGQDFNAAFAKVKASLGIKNLQLVQEKTLLFIDKKYCAMKALMKVSGIISTILLTFGSLFKIEHWPGASFLLMLGFFALCLLFLPSANYVMLKENKDRSLIIMLIAALIGSFSFFAGILFKIQHWPGANVLVGSGDLVLCLVFMPLLLRYLNKSAKSQREKGMYLIGIISGMIYLLGFLFKFVHLPGASWLLIIGCSAIVVLFLPLFTYLKYSGLKHIDAGFIYVVSAICWFLLITMLISLTISRDVLKEFELTYQETQVATNYLSKKNDLNYAQLKDSPKDSVLTKIRTATDKLDTYIQNLKVEIVSKLEDESKGAIYSGNKIDVTRITDKANTYIPFAILIGEKSDGKAFELHREIDLVRLDYYGIAKNDSVTCRLIDECLDTQIPAGAPEWIDSWEMLYFNHTSVIGCIDILSVMQRNLKLAENEMVRYVMNN